MTSARRQRIRTARLLAAAGTGRPVALLVHRSREARNDVRAHLERTGFSVAAVPTPGRARTWMEEADGPVDLLVVAEDLAGEDAETLARSGGVGVAGPAILRLASGGHPGIGEGRLRTGVEAVVAPPFTLRAVTRGVWSALQAEPEVSEGAPGWAR